MRVLTLVALSAALCWAADIRTGAFRGQQVRFENINGFAVYQGDIILGRTSDLEAALSASSRVSKSGTTPQSIGISAGTFFWPQGIVPYVIDTALPAAQQTIVHKAIDHWNNLTPIRFVDKTSTDYSWVLFTVGTSTIACSSSVGKMPFAAQPINLPPGCGFGETVHEMGHAVGLWHEQSRSDRNRFVTILYDNIDQQSAYNFDQQFGNAQDIGPYDFGSIMHYGSSDFAKDYFSTTIETVPAGIPIGQRDGLSPGDIQAVEYLYRQAETKTTITTAPAGLQVRVDGVMVAGGTAFGWAPGEQHTIEAMAQGDDQTRHMFASWSDGGPAAHTITASADNHLFIANFVRQFKLGTAVYPADSGTVALDPTSPDGFYTDRSDIRVQANPAPGFNLLNSSVFPPQPALSTWTNVQWPDTISATFVQGNVTTIASNPPGRTVIVDSNSYLAPTYFVWVKGETHTVKADTTPEPFEHYRFMGWDDGGAIEHTVAATGESATITATYLPQHSFVLQTDHGGGDVSASPPPTNGFYDEGTVVSIRAIPFSTNILLHWSGDVRGTQNPVNLTIDGQKFISADFEGPFALPPYQLVSAATGDQGPVAPGEIVTVYSNGKIIGPADGTGLSVAAGKVTTKVGGAEVLFDGKPAPVTYAGPAQINCVVPYGINSGYTSVEVRLNGETVFPPTSFPAGLSAPGIFTFDGSGRKGGAILNENGTYNTPDSPAPRGSVIVLYATGEGLTSPRVDDGTVNTTVFPKPLLPVSVRIAGRPAAIEYAGAAPSLVAGAMQINVRVPVETRSGPKIPLLLVIGDQASAEGVTLAVQ